MSDYILLILLNSLFIQGLYRSAMFEWRTNVTYRINKKNIKVSDIDNEFKMLLWWVRFYSIKIFGVKWSKPVITCPTCMASLHSTYIYAGYFYLSNNELSLTNTIIFYPVYVFALAGLNALVTSIVDRD